MFDKTKLTHINEQGEVRQVSVLAKPIVKRRAKAYGFISLSKETLNKIGENDIAKGNVLATAKIAGIQATKKTAELIPLCHSLLLEHVEISFDINDKGIGINATVETSAKTGVEMEALTAVNVALLTIYDMCKAVDKHMMMSDIKLIQKTKGDPQGHSEA